MFSLIVSTATMSGNFSSFFVSSEFSIIIHVKGFVACRCAYMIALEDILLVWGESGYDFVYWVESTIWTS